MKPVEILEDNDTIRDNDWCRPLSLCTMSGGMSDSMSFRSCYSGSPENNVKWTRVSNVLGDGWIGCTVKAITKALDTRYEFLRGDIPKSHILTEEDY